MLPRPQKSRLVLALLGPIALAPMVSGCTHPSHRYESTVQVVRQTIVARDEKAEPTTVDIELEWDPCPGDQFQVIRGGQELAKCMEKYKSGYYVPVHVSHFWDPHGYYRWDIDKIGDCERKIEPTSEGSYEKSQECHDENAYGTGVGFTCDRKPFRELVAICPWMARD
jgi:hypothetical protein